MDSSNETFGERFSRLAEGNQTLYTTHSPFLVGPDELDRVRVVEMASRDVGTKVKTSVTASDPAALLPLQEALGYDLAQSLFSQERNLILEGLTDYWYVEAVSAMLRASGDANLNEKIALVPANAASKVVYFATISPCSALESGGHCLILTMPAVRQQNKRRNCSPGGSTGYSLSWLRQSTAFPCRAMVVAVSGL